MEQMDWNILAFYLFAGMTVLGALMILFSKNIVHAIFMLVLVFFGIAAIYLISNAEFVGITQILVYIGGILILMMFGVMLTQRIDGNKMLTENRQLIPALLLGIALVVLFFNMFQVPFPQFSTQNAMDSQFSVTETIGIKLMTDHLLALELTAVLLLMALIGAAYIAGKHLKSKGK